jgi:hypothetical protein
MRDTLLPDTQTAPDAGDIDRIDIEDGAADDEPVPPNDNPPEPTFATDPRIAAFPIVGTELQPSAHPPTSPLVPVGPTPRGGNQSSLAVTEQQRAFERILWTPGLFVGMPKARARQLAADARAHAITLPSDSLERRSVELALKGALHDEDGSADGSQGR